MDFLMHAVTLRRGKRVATGRPLDVFSGAVLALTTEKSPSNAGRGTAAQRVFVPLWGLIPSHTNPVWSNISSATATSSIGKSLCRVWSTGSKVGNTA